MTKDAIASAIENPLRRDADGIRRIDAPGGPVSYPAEGHRLIREVEDASWWFRHRTGVILTLLRRYPPSGPFWDLGGGNGVVAKAVRDAGYPCLMVEASEEGCRNARARGVENVLRADLDSLLFRPGALDAAGLFDVLEHLDDPAALLRRLAEALHPERGKLFLTVPAHRWLWSLEDDWAGHRVRHGPRSLRRLLEGSGLEVLCLSHFFAWLSPVIFLGRTVPGWFRRRGARQRAAGPGRAHSRRGGPIGWIMDHRLAAEGRRIAHGRLSHGASLFAVCRKQPASFDL